MPDNAYIWKYPFLFNIKFLIPPLNMVIFIGAV